MFSALKWGIHFLSKLYTLLFLVRLDEINAIELLEKDVLLNLKPLRKPRRIFLHLVSQRKHTNKN